METPYDNNEIRIGGVFDCLLDEHMTLVETDESLYHFLGYSKEMFDEKFHGHLLEIVYEEDREKVLETARRQLAFGTVFMCTYRVVSWTGELYWVWISAEIKRDQDNGVWLHGMFHDITREKRNQEQLAISEQRYEIVLAQMQDIVFELDCETQEIYYSPNFEKKFGYSVSSDGFPDSMFESDVIYEEDKAPLRRKFQQLRQGENAMRQEYRIKNRDGAYLWVEIHATSIRDESGKLLRILGIIKDINSRKQEILEIRKTAVVDSLTGLYNRGECIRRIEEYIGQSSSMAAFLLIDVDNFKQVNDTMGHAYGDSVLAELAQGLRALFRQSDIIARLGGDEFVVFMTGLREKDHILSKVNGILQFLHSYKNAPTVCSLSCSIGCSIYPEHGTTFSTLLHKADAAMYHAKKQGKAQYYLYEEGRIPGFGENGEILPRITMQKSFHDQIIEYVFRFFIEHPENETAIPVLSGQLGAVFHMDRISIYEKADGLYQNTFCWSGPGAVSGLPREQEAAEGTSPEQGFSQEEQELSRELRQAAESEQVIAYSDVSQIKAEGLREWFRSRNTRSAVICFLRGEREGVLTAILYEDCQKIRQDGTEERYSLYLISQIIHLFLIHRKMYPAN